MQHAPRTAAGQPLVVSISVLLIVVAGEFTSGQAEEPTLPKPPHQTEPWTPPQRASRGFSSRPRLRFSTRAC